jgi:hypothetical protein
MALSRGPSGLGSPAIHDIHLELVRAAIKSATISRTRPRPTTNAACVAQAGGAKSGMVSTIDRTAMATSIIRSTTIDPRAREAPIPLWPTR